MQVTFRLYSESGHVIGESLNLFDQHQRDITARVDAIVAGRLGLLGKNFSILAIEGDGFAKRHVDYPGRGGYAKLLRKLNLCGGMTVDRISLRGVPSEFIVRHPQVPFLHQLTTQGQAALNSFTKALSENGVYIVHLEEKRPVTSLTLSVPHCWSTLAISHLPNKGKPTQLFKLKQHFGAERGQCLYDERKAREALARQSQQAFQPPALSAAMPSASP